MSRQDSLQGHLQILDNLSLESTAKHIYLQFAEPRQVLSSAVLGGGLVRADYLLNMKVPLQAAGEGFHISPQTTLQDYATEQGWQGKAVGLMTAASMDSLRVVECREQGVDLVVLVTAGLDNARRAGDPAEHKLMGTAGPEVGTINLIALTSAQLNPAALTEAVIIITEAKAAVLQELGICSPVSGGIATGTGTDSVAVVNGFGPARVEYCGKHVIFGELLARCVIEAMTASLAYYFPPEGGVLGPSHLKLREVSDA